MTDRVLYTLLIVIATGGGFFGLALWWPLQVLVLVAVACFVGVIDLSRSLRYSSKEVPE